MNKKYIKIEALEQATRRKSYKICNDGEVSKKDFLWTKKKYLAISYNNCVFLDEDLYINIPFPFKQQVS